MRHSTGASGRRAGCIGNASTRLHRLEPLAPRRARCSLLLREEPEHGVDDGLAVAHLLDAHLLEGLHQLLVAVCQTARAAMPRSSCMPVISSSSKSGTYASAHGPPTATEEAVTKQTSLRACRGPVAGSSRPLRRGPSRGRKKY